jgi:hypothetical protein
MVRLKISFGCALLLSASMLAALSASAQAGAQQQSPATATTAASMSAKAQPARTNARRARTAVVPPTPATPAPPPTLEQTPPTPPNVSYQNGQLTINAPNSTLSQVLHAVQARTGASIEVPAGAGSERVVAQLGPGDPRDVLNTLLNGSKFDYVILGVNGNPGAVQKVILTPRQSGTTATAENKTPPPQPQESPEEPPDTAENEYQNPDQPPPSPGERFRRPMVPGGQAVDPGAPSAGGEQQASPKTPEQMMQQMQQQRQQQQQYQQQLNPANQVPQQQ